MLAVTDLHVDYEENMRSEWYLREGQLLHVEGSSWTELLPLLACRCGPLAGRGAARIVCPCLLPLVSASTCRPALECRWCEALPPSRRDVLVVSGDVSDELAGGCCSWVLPKLLVSFGATPLALCARRGLACSTAQASLRPKLPAACSTRGRAGHAVPQVRRGVLLPWQSRAVGAGA